MTKKLVVFNIFSYLLNCRVQTGKGDIKCHLKQLKHRKNLTVSSASVCRDKKKVLKSSLRITTNSKQLKQTWNYKSVLYNQLLNNPKQVKKITPNKLAI